MLPDEKQDMNDNELTELQPEVNNSKANEISANISGTQRNSTGENDSEIIPAEFEDTECEITKDSRKKSIRE